MINIAELLKDAQKGMKLYSPLFGEVKFVGIDKQSVYPIDVTDCKGNGKSFTEFGVYFSDHPDAECLLFPSKDCRTWEGWKATVEPKFKVGDKIRSKSTQMTYTIIKIDVVNGRYELDYCSVMDFKEQDKFELVPKPHYDISNFHAGMPVLVRDNNKEWRYVPFSHITNGSWKFNAVGTVWEQCIPFKEDTKHLVGTTDMPDECYINW